MRESDFDAQRRHQYEALDEAHTVQEPTEWSGSPDPADPANYWIDDETGERVSAWTGERTPPQRPPSPGRDEARARMQGDRFDADR